MIIKRAVGFIMLDPISSSELERFNKGCRRFAIAILALMMVVTSGCIPIAIPTRAAKGYDLKKNIGTPGTKNPLMIGETSYAQFVSRAGPPKVVSADHHYAIYDWNTTGYTWFWLFLGVVPLPAFQDWDSSVFETALVYFDDSGKLSGWQKIENSTREGYVDLRPWGLVPRDAYEALRGIEPSLPPDRP